jgi:hypothetical protein
LLGLAGIASSILLGLSTNLAYGQNSNGTIAQGFAANNSKGTVVTGALVSFEANDAKSVELATTETVGRLAGIVDITPLVSIADKSQKVPVVLTGTASVLVSDINGAVKSGDKITISPISGVGMKATADTQIVGTAQSDFKISDTKTVNITDLKGNKHSVHIGRIPLRVGIAYYRAPGSDYLPPFIQNIANSVAGRPVSLIRIAICVILLFAGFVTAVSLVYAGARSAMTGLGRNPLAASSIRKGLYQTIFISGFILGAALLASYLILST